jgi:succinoglycan biosynthesis transport protein ExoP
MITEMASDTAAALDRTNGPGLRSAMRVVRERWWLIVLGGAVGLAIAVIYVATTSKSYSATAKVLLQPSSAISSAIVPGGSTSEDPTRIAATGLLLITSGNVGDAARKALGTRLSTSDLLSKVSASVEPNSDLYDITASDGDPARAARIANAFAEQFVAFRTRLAQQSALAAEQDLQQRIAALPKTDTAGITELQSALQRVQSLGAVQTGDATVVDTASPPTSPSSPRPKLDLALGLVFGLAAGLGLAFLVDIMDRRLKDDDGFEAAYGLNTLVHVPSRSLTPSGSQPQSPSFEPYRVLSATLSFSRTRSGIRSVLVTSAVAQEGKTTVAVGLAKALADNGTTVTLVELDQRRPSLDRHFPLDGSDGLTTALVNREPIKDVLQQPIGTLPGLNVLRGGPRIPLDLLRGAEMDHMMEQLLEMSEIIVYDAPPLLGVAESQALLDHPRIDTALIVARAYRTTRDEVKRARTILDQRLVRPLGLVITGLDEPGAGADYYMAERPLDGGASPPGRQRSLLRGPKQPTRS